MAEIAEFIIIGSNLECNPYQLKHRYVECGILGDKRLDSVLIIY